MAVEPNRDVSLGSLVSGIVGDLQSLVRNEIALVRQEVREEIDTAKSGAIKLGIAAGVLVIGSLFLLIALALGVSALFNLPTWAGFAIVGALFAIIGGVLLYLGLQNMKQFSAVPPKTVATMKENVEWIKDRTTSDKV